MPIHRNPDMHGDLIIQFAVEFPEKLPPRNVEQLKKLLPDDPNMPVEPLFPDNAEQINLVPISMEMLIVPAREEEHNHGDRRLFGALLRVTVRR